MGGGGTGRRGSLCFLRFAVAHRWETHGKMVLQRSPSAGAAFPNLELSTEKHSQCPVSGHGSEAVARICPSSGKNSGLS